MTSSGEAEEICRMSATNRTNRLETVNDQNWEEFTRSPVAVLVLARSDCPTCGKWTEELTAFLEPDETWERVRFGKINLDGADTEAFRNANEDWLGMVEGVPFNILYLDGTPMTSFAGSGVARLENRLRAVAGEKGA
jgi:hypothetical protein